MLLPTLIIISIIGFVLNPGDVLDQKARDEKEIENAGEFAVAVVEGAVEMMMEPDDYDPKEITPGQVEQTRKKYD